MCTLGWYLSFFFALSHSLSCLTSVLDYTYILAPPFLHCSPNYVSYQQQLVCPARPGAAHAAVQRAGRQHVTRAAAAVASRVPHDAGAAAVRVAALHTAGRPSIGRAGCGPHPPRWVCCVAVVTLGVVVLLVVWWWMCLCVMERGGCYSLLSIFY